MGTKVGAAITGLIVLPNTKACGAYAEQALFQPEIFRHGKWWTVASITTRRECITIKLIEKQ